MVVSVIMFCMGKLTFLTFLLICLCSILASVLVWLSFAHQKLKEEQAALGLHCEEATWRETYAEAKLEESNHLRETLKVKWQDVSKENSRLKADLEREGSGRTALKLQLEEAVRHLDGLRAELHDRRSVE
jgi:hypothetical protein